VLAALANAPADRREKAAEEILRTPERRAVELNATFAVRVMQRLRDIDPALAAAQRWIEEGLATQGLTPDAAVHAEHSRQTSAQATIANIISSMRLFSQAEWADFFESVSLVEQTLSRDPAGAYAAQDFATRDRYRHVETRGKRDAAPDRRRGNIRLPKPPGKPRRGAITSSTRRETGLERAVAYHPRRGSLQHSVPASTAIYLGAIGLVTGAQLPRLRTLRSERMRGWPP
jgi:hypothetical protein